MFKHSRQTLLVLVLLLSAFANMQPAPNHARPAVPKPTRQSTSQVVSIGDWLTAYGGQTFPANLLDSATPPGTNTDYGLIGAHRFDEEVIALSNLPDLIQSSRAAGIQVILKIEPCLNGGVQDEKYPGRPCSIKFIAAFAPKALRDISLRTLAPTS
jgi:hypothetical protein